MKGIKFSLMLFSHFLTSVFAIATPLQAPSNDTTLNLLLPTDASNLTSPTPPAGYQVLLHFDETIQLNIVGIYLNAIELMYTLAQDDWDSLVLQDIRMSVISFTIWILVRPSPTDRLRVSHTVIALEDSVIAMARLTGFYRLSARISLDGEILGHLDFGKYESPSDDNNDTGVSFPKDALLLINNKNNNNQSDNVSSNSGRIVDPYDSKLVITYEFYEQGIDSKEIFTLVLDSLAISAQFLPNEYCPVLEANSMSGTVAMSISNPLGGPTRLRYSALTRSLLLIVTGVIVRQRMFKEMEFSISYDGAEIAEGFMFKVARANNATRERSRLRNKRGISIVCTD